MKRILLYKGVTTADISQLADKGIYTAEFEYYTECQRKRYEYSALCMNDKHIDIVNELNGRINKNNE